MSYHVARLTGAAVIAVFCLILAERAACAQPARTVAGHVFDAVSGLPVGGARIVSGSASTQSASDGRFAIATAESVSVKAPGYFRAERRVADLGPPVEISLRPVRPMAVFLTIKALARPRLLDTVFALKGATKINAIVIDVKNKDGAIALAGTLGDALQDPAELRTRSAAVVNLLARAHRIGMYTIAHIGLFEDDLLARKDPATALSSSAGMIVADSDKRAWSDPRKDEVRAYNLSVAVAAAEAGFDEIQFDYIRFPTYAAAGSPAIHMTKAERCAVIHGFMRQAKTALAPYNVFISADLFGYLPWDAGDLGIGQDLNDAAAEFDYISLMLYPSSFKNGVPAAPVALHDPGKVVASSLERAQQRTKIAPIRFRPWLQGFRDDGGVLDTAAIAAQTTAADMFGADGWMLLHPHSLYSADRLPQLSAR